MPPPLPRPRPLLPGSDPAAPFYTLLIELDAGLAWLLHCRARVLEGACNAPRGWLPTDQPRSSIIEKAKPPCAAMRTASQRVMACIPFNNACHSWPQLVATRRVARRFLRQLKNHKDDSRKTMASFSAWHPCALRPAGWLRFDVVSNPCAGGGTGAMTSGLEDGLDKTSQAAKRQDRKNSAFGNEMDEWPTPGS